jgi:hypothetical protein
MTRAGAWIISLPGLHEVLHEKRRHAAISLASGMLAARAAAGLPIGAAITAALAVVGGTGCMPEIRVRRPGASP